MLDLDALQTYLEDHLAGAQAALALIERLDPERSDGLDVHALHCDVDDDRQTRLALLEAFGRKPSGVKQAVGRLAERLTRPKLSDDDALGRFESLELLGIGILGKLALWRTLETIRREDPRLDALGLERLEARAVEQHERVDQARLAWAPRAFGAGRAATAP